jgi:hypothetical protein
LDGRVVRKVSLCTTDEAAAQEQLLAWCLINRQHAETTQKARLADVLQRYRVCHGDLLRSAGRIRRSHEQWIEFHGPSFLLALSTLAHAPRAEPPTKYKVPTNEQECDQLYTELVLSPGDGAAIQHFLIGTNADHIMPDLCNRKKYQPAYDFAVPLIESNKQPLPQAPRQPSNCFLGSNC